MNQLQIKLKYNKKMKNLIKAMDTFLRYNIVIYTFLD